MQLRDLLLHSGNRYQNRRRIRCTFSASTVSGRNATEVPVIYSAGKELAGLLGGQPGLEEARQQVPYARLEELLSFLGGFVGKAGPGDVLGISDAQLADQPLDHWNGDRAHAEAAESQPEEKCSVNGLSTHFATDGDVDSMSPSRLHDRRD